MKKELPQYGLVQKDVIESNLPMQAKLIYTLLSCYANAMGSCYPSVDFICRSLSMNRKTFFKYVKFLTDAGIVEISQTRKSQMQFDSNTYQLTDSIHLRHHHLIK